MTPPPPRSTFFPYTTLLRSPDDVVKFIARRFKPSDQGEAVALLQAGHGFTLVDRKSTCLNSSHEWISYAVFCLKKKNCRLCSSSRRQCTVLQFGLRAGCASY